MILDDRLALAFVSPAARLSVLISLKVVEALLAQGERPSFFCWACQELTLGLDLGARLLVN